MLIYFYVPLFPLFGQHTSKESLPPKITELGLPYIYNYTPDEYGAYVQNWGIVKDSLGIMYFANSDGVLIFNGAEWILVELEGKLTPFSIAINSEGRIFVGSLNEFGYLEPDSLGQLKYRSLLAELPAEYHEFNMMRSIHTTEKGVYFCNSRSIFKWDGQKFEIWELDYKSWTFFTNDRLYVTSEKEGVKLLDGGALQDLPWGDYFIDMRVTSILAIDEELLITTLDNVFWLSENTPHELAIEQLDFLEDNSLYRAIELIDGSIALGSIYKGILIIDKSGRTLMDLSGEGIFNSNQIIDIFQDSDGILWAATYVGITKIEYPSHYTIFNDINGSPNWVSCFERFNSNLYLASSTGLFTLEYDMPTGTQSIKRFDDENCKFIKYLLLVDNELLLAGDKILGLDESGKTTLISELDVFQLRRSVLDTNRVFIAHSKGVNSMYRDKGTWKVENKLNDLNNEITGLLEDSIGNLWLRLDQSRVIQISFSSIEDAKNLENPSFRSFTTKDGLPQSYGTIHLVDHKFYFESENELYLYSSNTNRFAKDTSLYFKLGLPHSKYNINKVDADKNIWLINISPDDRREQLVALRNNDGSYRVEYMNDQRGQPFCISDFFIEIEDSVLWYEINSGFIRHDMRKQAFETGQKQEVLISKMLFKDDSLLFGGFGKPDIYELPFEENQFRFRFASPGFFNEKATRYQYYLEGFEKDWSAWTLETTKDYTNLREGSYTFKVRSINIFGAISSEAILDFRILPPWHRTWIIYFLYVLVGLLIIFQVIRWRSNQLLQKNLILEATVKERTVEVTQKNTQLESQTKLLTEKTEQLKVLDQMKTNFFSNISHEFRTPLTLIKGPIDQLNESAQEKLSPSHIEMIQRNTNRLFKLVNQLLDLSKLEEGKLKLELSEGDIYHRLRTASSSFTSHAEEQNIEYQVDIQNNEMLWASFDMNKLENIVYNLLGNAFKFTSDAGSVKISASYADKELAIQVEDTGTGIPTESLPKIFDRFYQVDDSITKENEGSGIGLSLVKELIELMGGTISVESEFLQGSIFRVKLPLEGVERSQSESDQLDEIDTIMTKREFNLSPKREAQVNDLSKVLVVEDNEDMRTYIKEQLQADYQLLEAENGQVGFEMAVRAMPDLIITDLMMPKLDGISLCKKLKEDINTSHIPIVMLTAKTSIDSKLEAFETGADAYLTKPFNAIELAVQAKNLIEKCRKLRELFSKKVSIDPNEVTITSLDEQLLQKVLELLEEKFTDSNFGIPQMREELAMSNAQLHRKIKALTNHSPGELLRIFRLKKAAQILASNGENVTGVAYTVGFNNLSYFAKCFKEFYGISPSGYAGVEK